MFSTKAAEHFQHLAALYNLKGANLQLLKIKFYFEDVRSLQILPTHNHVTTCIFWSLYV
jgi:hypothetical protein